MRRRLALLVFLAGCSSVPGPRAGESRTIAIPGTPIRFDVVFVPGKDGLRAYWIGKHEVTWWEFLTFEESAPRREWWRRPSPRADGATYPSESSYLSRPEPSRPAWGVRWHGAVSYCDWLTGKTGMRFRLPTEAEWEHAARMGFPRGDPAPLDEFACVGTREPQPVGSRKADALGVHDLLGNVWEMCLEPIDRISYEPAFRGGAWNSPSKEVGIAARTGVAAEWWELDCERPTSLWWFWGLLRHQGFRIVLTEEAVRGPCPDVDVTITGFAPREAKSRHGPGNGMRVRGEVVNRSARALDELELDVYWLDAAGAAHRMDVEGSRSHGPGRPTFAVAHPVLANSGREGPHRQPLRPGERRAFELDVPQAIDEYAWDARPRFGARVTAAVFARD